MCLILFRTHATWIGQDASTADGLRQRIAIVRMSQTLFSCFIYGSRRLITGFGATRTSFPDSSLDLVTAVIPKINDACSLPAALPLSRPRLLGKRRKLIPIMQYMQLKRFTQNCFWKNMELGQPPTLCPLKSANQCTDPPRRTEPHLRLVTRRP